MPEPKQLAFLENLAAERSDAHAVQLAKARQLLDAAEKQLEMLERYQGGYRQQMGAKLEASLEIESLRGHQRFMGNIALAVRQQELEVARRRANVDAAERAWQESERRRQGFRVMGAKAATRAHRDAETRAAEAERRVRRACDQEPRGLLTTTTGIHDDRRLQHVTRRGERRHHQRRDPVGRSRARRRRPARRRRGRWSDARRREGLRSPARRPHEGPRRRTGREGDAGLRAAGGRSDLVERRRPGRLPRPRSPASSRMPSTPRGPRSPRRATMPPPTSRPRPTRRRPAPTSPRSSRSCRNGRASPSSPRPRRRVTRRPARSSMPATADAPHAAIRCRSRTSWRRSAATRSGPARRSPPRPAAPMRPRSRSPRDASRRAPATGRRPRRREARGRPRREVRRCGRRADGHGPSDLAITARKDAVAAIERAFSSAVADATKPAAANPADAAPQLVANATMAHGTAVVADAQAATNAVPDTLRQPLGTPAWSQELGRAAVHVAASTLQSASLRINPEHLGPIDVQVRIDDGVAHLAFQAAHADTRSAIEASRPVLDQLFSSQGLSVGDCSVGDSSSRDAQSAADASGDRGSRQGRSQPGEDAPRADDDVLRRTIASRLAKPLGAVDTFA